MFWWIFVASWIVFYAIYISGVILTSVAEPDSDDSIRFAVWGLVFSGGFAFLFALFPWIILTACAIIIALLAVVIGVSYLIAVLARKRYEKTLKE